MTNANGEDKDLPNLDVLIKCMKMTSSDNDNQALVAMRAANRQLAKFGGDWEALLRGKVKIIGDPFASITMPPKVDRPGSNPMPPRRPNTPPPAQPFTPPRPTASPWTAPQPPKPSHGQTRSNFSAGNCKLCGSHVAPAAGRERYHATMGAWELEHAPGQCIQRRDNERPNKYAGKCKICSQRVEIAEGTTYHNGTKWMTEHLKGKCPAPDQRKRKQPLTSLTT